MVNQIRTLLLNLPATSAIADNEEFIPTDFTPSAFDSREADIYKAIFPSEWPRSYKNFVATLLANTIMDSDAWNDYGSKFDQRLSYDPRKNLSIDLSKSDIVINRIFNANCLVVNGTFQPDAANGLFSNSWTFSRGDIGLLNIFYSNWQQTETLPVFFNSDVSLPINLFNGLTAYLVGVTSVPVNFSAVVQASSPPGYSVMDLYSRMSVSTQIPTIVTTIDDTAFQKYIHSDNVVEKVSLVLMGYCLSILGKASNGNNIS